MQCRRGLAMRKLSVCSSVYLSDKPVDCDKTEERSVQIFIPYKRAFSLVFWEEEWLVGGDHPFYLKFWVNRPPLERNRRFWTDIRSEKSSINTNRKSTTSFPKSLRWSSYMAPKPLKGGLKNSRFPSKIAFRLKKVCYKVSLCQNCQRQSCKAFIDLTIRAKMVGGGRPLLPEILDQTDRVGAKSPIFGLFSLVATQP